MEDASPADDVQNAPMIGLRIRERRKKAALTLKQVAEAAKISTGYLSLIERDKALPTLTTLDRIARALGTNLEFFVAAPQPVDCLTRGDERSRFFVGTNLLGYERISAQFPGSELTSYVLTAAPGYASDIVSHTGEEHVFMLSGEMELNLDGEVLVLRAHDSVHYSSGRPHGWSNPNDTPAQILWTGTHDIFSR